VNVCLWTRLALAATLVAAAPLATLHADDSSNIKQIPVGDPEMAAAAAKARAGLDDFLAKLDSPPAGTQAYSVKIGIIDSGDSFAYTKGGDKSEFFWIGNIRRDGDGFTGTLGNEPAIVRNVRTGQELTFAKDDIFDWMYIRDRKIVGNITSCPLLLRGPKEELEFYRQNYGLKC
jgi:uncharacterized protein YegJ (DUF2314 family)